MVPPRTAMQQQQLGTRSRPVQLAGATAFAAMGATGAVVAGARHPYMHRTDTVDYAVVLRGSITMLLDDEDVELSDGDVVIQNGTNHAWANRGHAPCLMAFVLIDAPDDPPRCQH